MGRQPPLRQPATKTHRHKGRAESRCGVKQAPKKKAAAKPKKAGPSVGELIVKAVSASKERSGVSLDALKKTLAAGGYDVEKNNSRVKIAVKSLVTKGTLVQTKGTGSSGSFKLNKSCRGEEARKESRSPQSKEGGRKDAPAAKKPNKVAAKKPVAAKKSPEKAKKPATPKKAAQSPKKVKKRHG
ncbi:histone H1-like [Coregonus clupeaformis]|uniref:histone H1-like n=1 Tax=Coregonus clupeaformis TaxID=59861 RepID=UPI001BE001FA|nr:histone H1-like [Coregonus clupeaformis]